jgi:DNA-binding response OmpR family regulator
MLTARDSEAERALGLSLGADDYVVKPFSSMELLARVQALLRRSTGENHRIHRFGDIEVDFDRAEIRRNNRPVEVTALEFKLLRLFIQKRGRILTRDQLLDDIWRPESSPTDRAIDNHIMNLRRKIEADPQRPEYVVSVRGLGYRFEG